MPAAVQNYQQTSYAFYNDNGGPSNPNNATLYTAEKVEAYFNPNINIRVRIQTKSISATPSDTFTLYYAKDGGAYASLPLVGSDLHISSSSRFTDGAATTARLTNPSSTFIAGQAKDTGITTGSESVSGRYTENEWCIQFTSSAVGHTYRFHARSSSVGDSGVVYSFVPTITIVNSPSLRVSNGPLRISNNKLRIHAAKAQVFTYLTTGSQVVTAPATAVSVRIQTWAAGAGGFRPASPITNTGGGGGGGAYAESTIPIIGGSSHTIVVGVGGSGATSPSVAGDGGDSTFDSTVVVAKGGLHGTLGLGGLGGSAAASTGTITHSGGKGGNGTASSIGGGGGGGAGSLGDGGNSSAGSSGAAGSPDGGAGGGGGGATAGDNANPGTQPGGGGGGCVGGSNTPAAGAAGKIVLTYIVL